MVLPLRTTSRLSVSIVILVVFTTTARSNLPHRYSSGFGLLASCATPKRKVFNAQFNISQWVFNGALVATNARA